MRIALREPQRSRQGDLEIELLLLTRGGVWQIGDQQQPSSQLPDRLDERRLRHGMLARAAPIGGCRFEHAAFGEVVGQDFGVRFYQSREVLFERAGDPRVQCPARDTQ